MRPGTGASNLCGDLAVDVIPDAPIGASTWYGIGGRADLLVRPHDMEALATLARRCARLRMPLRVLGGGANLLVGDEGVDGVVVALSAPAFGGLELNPTGAVQAMRIGAGADLARTLMDTVRRGLAGLEALAGIPGTIGGALRMNAGGAFGAVGDRVRSVTCLTRQGEVETYPARELRFEYRHTNIPDAVILSAVFELAETDPVALRERVKEIFAFKKSTQPLADHSAGCAFRNPWDPSREERVSAGRLIDEAGCKGLSIGGATVSPQHANFIVTVPGASATDVLALMDQVKRRVFDRSGLELEREVVVWGRETMDGG